MADLHRVWAFLAERNPRAGGEARDRILGAVELLATTPFAGRQVEDAVRALFVPHGAWGYVIRYRVQDDEVVIARVWHGRERRP
jgi:plasmid stabilization system protein ParE